MDTLLQDLRYALRTLRKSPGFTFVAVLTLALGIGATTAVFSLVNGVLLRPLPYPEVDRLFALYEATPTGALRLTSYPTFRDWRELSDVFEAMTYIRGEELTLRADEGTQRLLGAHVSPEFFDVIHTRPLLGRALGAADHADGAGAVVLSHHLWRQAFGGDPDVIGRTLDALEGAYTIVGVMPLGIDPAWADLWLPLSALPAGAPVFTRRDLRVDSRVLGRLREGVPAERAQEAMDVIAREIASAYPEDAAGWTGVRLVSLREEVLGDVRPRLVVLAAAVALVLLIGCANVTSLMLARATTRARELAVRVALGAGTRHLVRHLLAEALVLALAGGVLGVLFAHAGVGVLSAMAPDALPRLEAVVVDGRVLAFTLAISLATALAVGLVPAMGGRRSDLASALKSGAPGGGADPRRGRLRAALVVAETAMALVLLIGAALLIKSLWLLQQERLGFEPRRVAAVRIYPPSPRYDDPASAALLYRRLEAAAASVPGVERAAIANHVPLGGPVMRTRVMMPGREPDPDESTGVLYRTVSPDYFETLRIPLIRGRDFEPADLGPADVAVVNEAFADRYFPVSDPLGQTLTVEKAAQDRPDFGEALTLRIVGVAGDVRALGLDLPPAPTVYVPYTANPWGNTFLVARTTGDPGRSIPALRRAILEVDPDLPIAGPGRLTQLRPMHEYVSWGTEQRELHAGLLAGFAGAALLLALLGIFGLLAYHVAQRSREIGVRVALGAGPPDVLGLIIGHGLRLVAVGILLGLLGAFAATRILRGLVYGVSVTDPVSFAVAAALFTGVAILASYLPARRAMRVDPMVALRNE
ncbi:MAG: ABC transporter permease [Thermoleophilaceae bacterium]